MCVCMCARPVLVTPTGRIRQVLFLGSKTMAFSIYSASLSFYCSLHLSLFSLFLFFSLSTTFTFNCTLASFYIMGAPIALPLSNTNATTPKKKKMPSQLVMAFVIGFFFICFFGVDTMYRRSSGMFSLSSP